LVVRYRLLFRSFVVVLLTLLSRYIYGLTDCGDTTLRCYVVPFLRCCCRCYIVEFVVVVVVVHTLLITLLTLLRCCCVVPFVLLFTLLHCLLRCSLLHLFVTLRLRCYHVYCGYVCCYVVVTFVTILLFLVHVPHYVTFTFYRIFVTFVTLRTTLLRLGALDLPVPAFALFRSFDCGCSLFVPLLVRYVVVRCLHCCVTLLLPTFTFDVCSLFVTVYTVYVRLHFACTLFVILPFTLTFRFTLPVTVYLTFAHHTLHVLDFHVICSTIPSCCIVGMYSFTIVYSLLFISFICCCCCIYICCCYIGEVIVVVDDIIHLLFVTVYTFIRLTFLRFVVVVVVVLFVVRVVVVR